MTITKTPPPGMKPITDYMQSDLKTKSASLDFLRTAAADAIRAGKQVAFVRKKSLVAVFTTGVKTMEEVTREASRTKTKGGVRPTRNGGRL